MDNILKKVDRNKPTDGMVYCALNRYDDKFYIGSTIDTMETRRYAHYSQAFSKRLKTRSKFHKALKATKEEDWDWFPLEEFTNITPTQLREHEGEYQRAADSVEHGYNTSYAAMDKSMTKQQHRARYKRRAWARRIAKDQDEDE